MSEVQKPLEATPSAVPAVTEPVITEPVAISEPIAPAATEPMGTEHTPAVSQTTEIAPVTVAGESAPAPVTEEAVGKGEAKVEATPASEGVLGYKAPGFLNQLRFKQQFFWFGDEAVRKEHLSNYLNDTKAHDAHHNVAWSSQTGKGLLYHAKRSEDKPHAHGIINLAEIAEVAKESFNEFSFKLHGQKHTFQTGTNAERASWLVAIEKESAAAKEAKEGIVASEGYKEHNSKIAKPAAIGAGAAAVGAASTTPKKSFDTNTAAKASTTPVEAKPTPTESKSRSQSRKRTSIFGTLRGKSEVREEKKELKKEEKAERQEEKAEIKELKKEEKAEEKAERKEEKAEAKEEKAQEKAEKEVKKHDHHAGAAPAVVGGAAGTGPIAATEHHNAETREETPENKAAELTGTSHPNAAGLKSKRGSVFGNLFARKESTTPKIDKTETAPVVPAKDNSIEALPVAAEAPQLSDPVTESGAAPISTSEVTAPIHAPENQMPVADENKTFQTEAGKSTQTGTSPVKAGGLLGFLHKQEAKMGGNKDDETPTAGAATTATMEPTATSPVAVSALPTTETHKEPVRDKRRTSLFGGLGSKKEKRGDATSDNEGGKSDGEKKSPLPGKLGDLFRKPTTKAPRKAEETHAVTGGTDSTPVPVDSTNHEPLGNEAGPLTNSTSSQTHDNQIGDVVPNAVTTGQTHIPEVQASA